MALEVLSRIKSPTLLIVGGADSGVIELNEKAYLHIQAVKEMVLIPDATHLFEEPGALDEVAKLAAKWFRKYLAA
jgi:pimeloyl-ACP methyl ester carboxylesterase